MLLWALIGLLGVSAVSGQGTDPHGNAAPNVLLGSKNTLNVHHGKLEVAAIDNSVGNAMRALREQGQKRAEWEAKRNAAELKRIQQEAATKQSEADNKSKGFDDSLARAQKIASKKSRELLKQIRANLSERRKQDDEEAKQALAALRATEKRVKSFIKRYRGNMASQAKKRSEAATKQRKEDNNEHKGDAKEFATKRARRKAMLARMLARRQASEKEQKTNEAATKKARSADEKSDKKRRKQREIKIKAGIKKDIADARAQEKKDKAAEKTSKQKTLREATSASKSKVFARKAAAEKKAKQAQKTRLNKGLKLVSGETSPQKGKNLRASLPWSGRFTFTFWIRVNAAQGGWNNVFHKGNGDYQRNPAVWLYPGTTQLHVRSSGINNAPNWNGNTNPGCDPTEHLGVGTWRHVAIIHSNGRLRVYLDGMRRCTSPVAGPAFNSGPLWFSNPWYPAAQVSIKDFRYFTYPLSPSDIAALILG